MSAPRLQRGLTLVELIIAIVVMGVAVSGVLLVFTTTVARSADPMIQQQAGAIAEAYMEEVLLRPFTVGPETGVRANFDDIFDYDGLDEPPTDQFGNALGLAGYNVRVEVTADPSEGLGGIPGSDVARIDVKVSHTSGHSVQLTGYRTNYE
ncbi:prepilin-type N-terminal cleavage/methylation domain-containing protein [Ectothiorhodospiraceae bacterium 2226]|nr:prepilin-type N-terminal cleavage/methylation domain-containing protein [Ectothiorhodospiraceae bacterium 2226]